MNDALNTKTLNVTPPAAVKDNASFVCAAVDTLGFRYCTFEIVLGALDIGVSALKLQTSNDDASADPYADIVGADYSVDSTLPAATEDNGIFAIHVDLRGSGKKRWLKLVFTAGDGAVGTYATVLARLSRGEVFARSAADRGYTRELFV
jgi:hypothetical protein